MNESSKPMQAISAFIVLAISFTPTIFWGMNWWTGIAFGLGLTFIYDPIAEALSKKRKEQ